MSYSPYTYIDSPLFDPNFDMNRCSTTTPLYIQDLDTSTDEPTLYNFFCKYGPVYSIQLTQTKEQRFQGKRAAFIHFYFRKDAESALKDAQYHKIGRFYITIRLVGEGKELLTKARINVENIEPTVTVKELHSHFEKSGANVLYAKVDTDAEGKSLGHGYVICRRKEDANYAMCRLLMGTKLKDRVLKLSINASNYRVNQNIDEKTLYVKYLPVNQDQKSLLAFLDGLFGRYGEIRTTSLKKHPRKDMYLGIVEFKRRESAIGAYTDLSENLRDYGAPEGPLYVDWHQDGFDESHNGEIHSQSEEKTLFVKNLRLTVKDEDLRRVFKRFGIVRSVSWQDHVCGNSKKTVRCGYICFSTEEEAHKAWYDALNFSEVRDLFDHHAKPYINLYHSKKETEELDHIKRELMVEFQYMNLVSKMYEANPFAFMAMQQQQNIPRVGVFSPVFNINQQMSPSKVDLTPIKVKEFSPQVSPSPKSQNIKSVDTMSLGYQMRDFYKMRSNNQKKVLEKMLIVVGRRNSPRGFETSLNKEKVKELLGYVVEKELMDGKYRNLVEKVGERLVGMIGGNYEKIMEFVMNEGAQKEKLEDIAEQIDDENLLKEAGDNLLKDDVSDTYSINDEDMSMHFKENRNPNVLLNSLRVKKEGVSVGSEWKIDGFENRKENVFNKEKDIELITQACLGMNLEKFMRLDVHMQRTRLGQVLFQSVREIAGDQLALKITPMLADLSKYRVKEIIETIGFKDLLMQRINESMREIGNGRK